MAKIYGLFGAMTGKVADAVMLVRNGEQIVRKYQPIVSNPSTPAQVAARAKLKLASQLSAVMAPYIAIPREGSVSSRNLFVKENYGSLSFVNNEANVDLAAVKLTRSVVSFPAFSVSRDNLALSMSVQASPFLNVDRVVYVAFNVQADKSLRALGSVVVTEPGSNNTFPGSIPVNLTSTAPVVVYAYGVRDNTETAKVVFSNMEAISATMIAQLFATRRITAADVTLTETRSAIAPIPNKSEDENDSEAKKSTKSTK